MTREHPTNVAASPPGDGWDIISTYSRAEALEDGALVDVSETAREAGIRYPVALTRGAWAEAVEVPRGAVGQDEAGRLWDVFWSLRMAIRAAQSGADRLTFRVSVVGERRKRRTVDLVSVCGPGDDAEPVITVMLPGED